MVWDRIPEWLAFPGQRLEMELGPETPMSPCDQTLFDSLRNHAERSDREGLWPHSSWQSLIQAGVLKWSVPKEYGGLGLSQVEQLERNEVLASSCLTTAFLLSQREAAVRLIIKGPESIRQQYLPPAANGEIYLTIGVSQLTTSRQHCAPAVQGKRVPDGYTIDGIIPWVTGAPGAQLLVAGATLDDGSQILFALPLPCSGVSVGAPLALVALAGSCTTEVRCSQVFIRDDKILAGPGAQLLGKVGGGGLETSCLALGLSTGAISYLEKEAQTRSELVPIHLKFAQNRNRLRHQLYSLAQSGPQPEETLKLRAECTRLALNATQVALLLSKGTGFVVPHPVQRWARQALFFLVWSCPRPVASEVLEGLIP